MAHFWLSIATQYSPPQFCELTGLRGGVLSECLRQCFACLSGTWVGRAGTCESGWASVSLHVASLGFHTA